MNEIRLSCLILIFLCPISLIAQDSLTRKDSYLKSVVDEYNIEASRMFYVTDKSEKDFISHMQSSMLAFIKGNKFTSIDLITVKDEDGEQVTLNSCDASESANITLTKSFLNDDKNYKGLDIKNMESGELYSLHKDRRFSLLLFSHKLGILVKTYINRATLLEEKEHIEYIVITTDIEDLDEIENIYKNPFN
jgi:hypothetical protein